MIHIVKLKCFDIDDSFHFEWVYTFTQKFVMEILCSLRKDMGYFLPTYKWAESRVKASNIFINIICIPYAMS